MYDKEQFVRIYQRTRFVSKTSHPYQLSASATLKCPIKCSCTFNLNGAPGDKLGDTPTYFQEEIAYCNKTHMAVKSKGKCSNSRLN